MSWDEIYSADKAPFGQSSFWKLLEEFLTPGMAAVELGCGQANNLAKFVQLQVDYAGIDFSTVAIEKARKKYPSVRDRFVCGDFTNTLPFSGMNVVCERASVTHNDIESIRRCIALVHSVLPVGGLFISMDWFSTFHSEFSRGAIVDEFTRTDYPDGQFYLAGNVHFSSKDELLDLFDGWECFKLEERITRYLKPDPRATWLTTMPKGETYVSAVWDQVWEKR